ncbi:MAG: TonB-dependent receptor [Cyclobacteriaceae bacterium]|nr:TonB-dependent receptor [Cyclobacteriaceae bacterium]
MNRFFKFLTVVPVILVQGLVMAQEGMIRGTVIDGASGEALFGVTVVIKGTTTGKITDFDGAFEIKTDPGNYDIQASFVSYKTVTISDVEVKSNEVTIIDQIPLREDIAELEEIVITAEAINNSESALLTLKRKSVILMDGISAANFRKIGDSDAGQAAKRVTGVSVEGGKYVYVRGLGDRYTKTTMNDVDIPGLDPDRNSIQIDIFPTTLIDNMIVLKSFVPELPADFTGGIINIETKDFPDERILDVSFSAKYNPSMHFNNEYLTYQGGSRDYLGYDDGTRALPEQARQEIIPSPISGDPEAEVNSFLKEFNPNLGAIDETSFMNYNVGLTFADQSTLGNGYKLGYILSGTYKSTQILYDDVFYGEYQRPIPEDTYEFVTATTQEGVVAENNVLLGGLAGIALKTNSSKYKLNLMHLQNGESRTAQFSIYDNGEAPGKSGFIGYSNNLEYNQRGLTNVLLNGVHYNTNGSWKVDWRTAATLSTLEDPDIRKTAFTINPNTNDSSFLAGAAGNPSRIWRSLDELNIVGKLDVTREHKMFGESAKLKFGGSYIYKERDYEILSYDVQFFGRQADFGGNPDNVLKDENLYPEGKVYYSSGNNVPNPNEYNSNVSNAAFYISSEFNPFRKLKSIIGVRGENFEQRHTGRDVEYANSATGEEGKNLDNDIVLEAFDLFPSVNLIYAVKEQQNIRFAYSRTIARPSFKELSFAQILDPVSNRIFNGGLFTYADWDGNLTETRIDNFDIRWELFMKSGQMISFGAFYKLFDDPIELVRIPAAQTTNEFQPRNVGDSKITGLEFEFRNSLEFISTSLKNFSINGNFTYVRSYLKMTETEFNSRKGFEKVGETISDTREMAGQAPYIINAGLAYDNPKTGFDAGVFYNVKGATLTVVGGGLFPDVYSQPFHSLNFNLNKSIGASEKMYINISVSNILNDVREEFYTAYNAMDQIFYRYSPGTEFGIGFRYNF